ncbi:phosphoglycerate dehydrogenase [Haloflavibacter putidus]|uniref:D-3-phosphoglycerate dehydrogenase n=1 Tax=Haloflavibacter putidus TaxID=2576776 RepID=A0A507ZU65_9FLAO|nr:phosphoglycerate dehydrogenase [Haloflavibacter putidus]TQD39288.1 phosphoglycerate dehydrogenase [Haloflavibacter putidus]
MAENKNFIIDFDSTFTKVEGLEALAEIALHNKPNKKKILEKIETLTEKAMQGDISFRESLEKRLALLPANKDHLKLLIVRLQKQISTSFNRNPTFFTQYKNSIYIVSSGFKDFIIPVVERLGLSAKNVYANTFTYDKEGNITGFDEDNILSTNNGKVKLLQQLDLQGDVYVVGDGYTDYEMKAAGLANKFYAFTENVAREKVMHKADHITPSLDEFLYVHQMNRTLSYPKNRIKVLLLENIHADAKKIFEEEGYQIESLSTALDEAELAEKIKDVSILGIRSKSLLTEKVLKQAKRLIGVGAFCIGTNQIDLEACAKKGVSVFNAPFSNTRSVVELAIGEIIFLLRNLPTKMQAMQDGNWQKSAQNSYEIRGKKLGIIGYGNIGAQLSVLAENMGLDVYYYDIVDKLPLGNVTKCKSLKQLLTTCDIISLHVEGKTENKNLLGEEELNAMKKGSILLNLSRGEVVDLNALKKALESGNLAGAGIDVFPEEPKTNQEKFTSVLQGMPNVILTPHIGGSTIEAQENIANFVANKIIKYVNTGSSTSSVNFPNLQLPQLQDAHRLLHIHYNRPGILAEINSIFGQHNINIDGQYLKTNQQIGYVITDVNKAYDEAVVNKLKSLEGTIKFRVLY